MTSPNAPRMLTTDVPLTELTGEQLRARVARAQLYLYQAQPVAGAPAPTTAQEHALLAHLHQLEQQGRLYGYGPLGHRGEGPMANVPALGIIAASSLADAEAMAAADPYVLARLRTVGVRGHTMNEGVACYVGRALSRRLEASGVRFSPNPGQVGLTRDELAARAVGARLYLVEFVPTDKPRPKEDAQAGLDHFVWLRSNEMAARLMSCGPLEPLAPLSPGIWGGGLGVFAVGAEQAMRIAAEEPSGKRGYRIVTASPWTLELGIAAPIATALTAVSVLR
ncbi:MAG: hypothetical protein VW450_00705 [Chloroflexota bacterium]